MWHVTNLPIQADVSKARPSEAVPGLDLEWAGVAVRRVVLVVEEEGGVVRHGRRQGGHLGGRGHLLGGRRHLPGGVWRHLLGVWGQLPGGVRNHLDCGVSREGRGGRQRRQRAAQDSGWETVTGGLGW